MTERRDSGLVYACLTHVPLWLEFPSYVTTIHLGQSQRDGRLNLRDLAPEWEPHHPVLGGTAGAFALRRHVLRHCPDATRIGICQYRKFVSRERISAQPDLAYRSMDLVGLQQLPPDVFARALDPGDRQWLIGRPLTWGRHWKRSRRMTYLDQFASTHHVEDLLRFAAAAVEVGALDKAEVAPFLEEDCFLPGGIELGVFPAPFWLAGIEALEAVVRTCVHAYPAPRSGAQARSWAFCAERLGSYFVLREHGVVGSRRLRFRRLAQWFPPEWVKRCTGQLNVIMEPGTNAYIPGA